MQSLSEAVTHARYVGIESVRGGGGGGGGEKGIFECTERGVPWAIQFPWKIVI